MPLISPLMPVPDGSVVLYFKNSFLLSGNLYRQSMSVEVPVRNMTTCALASVFSVGRESKQKSSFWLALTETLPDSAGLYCLLHSVNRFVQQGTCAFSFHFI